MADEIGTLDGIDVIELLFSDVNPLLNVMNQLTDNYRLLVGAAEELTRTPGASQRMVNQALDRVENTGTLIDLVIVSLFIKILFVTEVLDATGLPLTLIFELLEKSVEEARDPDNLLPRPPILEKAHDLEIKKGADNDCSNHHKLKSALGSNYRNCSIKNLKQKASGNYALAQKKLKAQKKLAQKKLNKNKKQIQKFKNL